MAPKNPKDLALAPVAAAIDLNLQHLRDKSPSELDFSMALAMNRDTAGAGRDERAAWVCFEATREVDMHAWEAAISDDSDRLHLSGGSVTLDLGLSAGIMDYIKHGAA